MVKQISVSDEAYEWILKKSSKQSINDNRKVSMADVVDDLIKQ